MDVERRKAVRKPLAQEVAINNDQGMRFCKLQNISIDGAFLDIGWSALTRNVPVELSLTLPDDDESLRLEAQVARVSTNGTAIKFKTLDLDSHRALSHFINS